MTTNRERAGLALMGCAIGDCLGFPFENAFVPSGWDGEPVLPLSAWTDDTQQSLVLVGDTCYRTSRQASGVAIGPVASSLLDALATHRRLQVVPRGAAGTSTREGVT